MPVVLVLVLVMVMVLVPKVSALLLVIVLVLVLVLVLELVTALRSPVSPCHLSVGTPWLRGSICLVRHRAARCSTNEDPIRPARPVGLLPCLRALCTLSPPSMRLRLRLGSTLAGALVEQLVLL
jgi:hypothetical protein